MNKQQVKRLARAEERARVQTHRPELVEHCGELLRLWGVHLAEMDADLIERCHGDERLHRRELRERFRAAQQDLQRRQGVHLAVNWQTCCECYERTHGRSWQLPVLEGAGVEQQ